MIKGIHHMALVVRDLVAAERYYCATAGMHRLPIEAAQAIAPISLQLATADYLAFNQSLLAGRNGYLELLAPQWPSNPSDAGGNPINRPGIRHFCVQNFDCALLERAVLEHGGSLIASPLDLGTGNQYAYSRDPERNIMEIEGLPYAPAREPTWLGHVAVVTRNMDRAIAFYEPLFGTGLHNRGWFGPGPQFDRMGGLINARIEGAWLQAGNMLLELWQFHAPEAPPELSPRQFFDPGYSHLCLETDALDADSAQLIQLGGKLLGGASEGDQLRSVFACDPEGNLIELLELRETDGPLSIAALADRGVCVRVEAGRR
jgi:catechol 2,3-dioxygenase-like lactoylglutathione lyase family enzyme